jgi:hypothetical protein
MCRYSVPSLPPHLGSSKALAPSSSVIGLSDQADPPLLNLLPNIHLLGTQKFLLKRVDLRSEAKILYFDSFLLCFIYQPCEPNC